MAEMQRSGKSCCLPESSQFATEISAVFLEGLAGSQEGHFDSTPVGNQMYHAVKIFQK
jgi:hypothetical protein